jgi:hypothetical protein
MTPEPQPPLSLLLPGAAAPPRLCYQGHEGLRQWLVDAGGGGEFVALVQAAHTAPPGALAVQRAATPLRSPNSPRSGPKRRFHTPTFC